MIAHRKVESSNMYLHRYFVSNKKQEEAIKEAKQDERNEIRTELEKMSAEEL